MRSSWVLLLVIVQSTIGRILFIGQNREEDHRISNEYGYLGHLLISQNETSKKINKRIAAGRQSFGKYVDS